LLARDVKHGALRMGKLNADRIARRKRRFRHRSTIGTIPGTLLVHESSEETVLRVISYDARDCVDEKADSIQDLLRITRKSNTSFSDPAVGSHSRVLQPSQVTEAAPLLAKQSVTWINVDGLNDTRIIKQIGDLLDLHPLALEDVVNVHQRAKFEDYGQTLFFVIRMPTADPVFHTEQVSIFLCGDVVLTLQERPGDCLEALRGRIAQGLGRIRTSQADYLTYAIVDAIIDGYFTKLESYGDALDELTASLGETESKDVPIRLHGIRGSLLSLRRVVRQQRDALQQIQREPHLAISRETQLYFRDCLDHVSQLLDATDAERETCAELRELYFAMLGQRNNDVMKVLTIVSTIFIPMSFIAGVYGMNFEPISSFNMPELRWTYGYPAALLAMASVAVGLCVFPKRKGWL
jgi:magnesium transporter